MVAIVIGLQTVGVVLMSAMIVAPAAAARQWTDRLGRLVLLAGAFGALAGLVGAVLSSLVAHLPTGPTIVLAITAIAVLSLLFAPRRGLVAGRLRAARQRRRLQVDAVLADLYRLAAQHPEPEAAPHAAAVLRAMSERHGVRRSLGQLAGAGLAREDADGRWRLTPAGVTPDGSSPNRRAGERRAERGPAMSMSASPALAWPSARRSWRSSPSPWSPPSAARWWAPSSCCAGWPCSATPSVTPSCPASCWPSSWSRISARPG